MELQVSIYTLEKLLLKAAEMGPGLRFRGLGKLKPFLKKAEAFRLYGRSNVEHWITQGPITALKDGDHLASLGIEWLEIEAVCKARNLIRYL